MVRLQRQDPGGMTTDWFHLFVAPKGQSFEFAGGLRFTRGSGRVTINTRVSSYGFIFDSDAMAASTLPLSYIEVNILTPTPLSATTDFTDFPNSSTAWDPMVQRYRLQFGATPLAAWSKVT